MKNFFSKSKNLIKAHKFTSTIILILIIILGYWQYKSATSTSAETRYVTTTVQKGTIISSVSASGQVETSNQLDLKVQGSGQITYVGVNPGDTVKKGKLLFSLDSRAAQKTLRDAEANLKTAQLDLEKFQQPPDNVAVLAIKKAISDAEQSKIDAAKTTKDKYTALLNTSTAAVSSNPLDTQTPPTISGTYTKGVETKITISLYQSGSGSYFSAISDPSGIVNSSGTVSTVTPQPIGDSGLYIKFSSNSANQPNWVINLPNKSATAYNDNFTAYQDALNNEKKTNDTADLTIAQNNKSLHDLYQPDTYTLQTKQLSVTQAQNSVDDARQNLSDYYVVAPFDGVIATATGKVGDIASGSLGTIITHQKIALLSMNEVDVSKIQLGDKATVTFDAIDNLTLTGTVVEIDPEGTVTQGVVSYGVKIAFDTDDSRIKSGMSVSASIIIDSKTDVLYVPSSSIKTQGNSKYVLMFSIPLPEPAAGTQGTTSKINPEQIPVETGISDDSNTEILSGLKEGEQIVLRTVTGTKTNTTPNLLNSVGGNRNIRGTGRGFGG